MDICNSGLQGSNAARVFFALCLSSVVFAASSVTPAAPSITAGPHLKTADRGALVCLGITFSAEPKVKETAALCIKKSERRYYMLSHSPESAAARSILAITIPPREVCFDSTISTTVVCFHDNKEEGKGAGEGEREAPKSE